MKCTINNQFYSKTLYKLLLQLPEQLYSAKPQSLITGFFFVLTVLMFTRQSRMEGSLRSVAVQPHNVLSCVQLLGGRVGEEEEREGAQAAAHNDALYNGQVPAFWIFPIY